MAFIASERQRGQFAATTAARSRSVRLKLLGHELLRQVITSRTGRQRTPADLCYAAVTASAARVTSTTIRGSSRVAEELRQHVNFLAAILNAYVAQFHIAAASARRRYGRRLNTSCAATAFGERRLRRQFVTRSRARRAVRR
ncbi:hypothetical protein WI664_10865 [Vibrio cholerae]